MAYQRSRFPIRRQVWNSGNPQHRMEYNNQTLFQEIDRLNMVLNTENVKYQEEMSRLKQLHSDLTQTTAEWKRQKAVKEIYINKGKETKRLIERLQNYSNAETLSVGNVDSKVQDTKRHKKKKMLQKDYEMIKVAHIINQERFSRELQAEQEKGKAFQEELDRARGSYQEMNLKYQTDILPMRQKTETLQQQLERAMKSHADQTAQNQHSIHSLRAEQDTVCRQMEQEITSIKQTSKDRETRLNGDLEQIKLSYRDLTSKYETDVLTVRKQADSYQQQLNREVAAHAQTVKNNVELFNKMKAEQGALHQAMTQEITFLRQTTSEKKSFFQTEVEGLKAQLKRQISINDELSAELKERDDIGPPKRKRARLELPNQEQAFIPVFFPQPETTNNEPEPMDQTQLPEQIVLETEDSQPEPINLTQASDDSIPQTSTKSPSVWKKARHFLGLRKPKKWKKNEKASNQST